VKLIEDTDRAVTVEVSEANLRALFKDFERTGSSTEIVKHHQGVLVRLRVVRNEAHYSDAELSERRSPYLPPEAWAGVL
jgi:hypothetical protein